MKAQLEKILAELESIDAIEINAMETMFDVLQKMEGLMGSLGEMFGIFESMPAEQAAEIAPLFEQVREKMEGLQIKIDNIEFNQD